MLQWLMDRLGRGGPVVPVVRLSGVIASGNLFGSRGLAEYTAVSWCIGAAAVRFYEEPVLTRKFGAEYRAYRRAVPAWLPRLRAQVPGTKAGHADNRPD